MKSDRIFGRGILWMLMGLMLVGGCKTLAQVSHNKASTDGDRCAVALRVKPILGSGTGDYCVVRIFDDSGKTVKVVEMPITGAPHTIEDFIPGSYTAVVRRLFMDGVRSKVRGKRKTSFDIALGEIVYIDIRLNLATSPEQVVGAVGQASLVVLGSTVFFGIMILDPNALGKFFSSAAKGIGQGSQGVVDGFRKIKEKRRKKRGAKK